ncbi:MAG: hypothetical protein QOI95_82 [Acidimicrobiaceae bacterium]
MTTAAQTPTEVRLRAYNVGFGDCILITITYRDRSRRHLLVDFGSTKAAGTTLRTTAEALRDETQNEGIAAAIVTHQHRDHITGFATKPKRSDDPVAALKPKLLIRPWMDQPEPSRVGRQSRRHAQLLRSLDSLVNVTKQRALRGSPITSLLNLQLVDTAASQVLADWEANGTRTIYVKAGDRPSITRYLPGVSLDIIGPPTVEQVPFLASYDRDDPEQFWARHQAAAATIKERLEWTIADKDLDTLAGADGLGAAAWLANRMNDSQRSNLLAVARGFDSFLNNTSVIALLKVGARTLLLCGDAQIENWSHALALADALTPGLRARFEQAGIEPPEPDGLAHRLANIDLYKVGHHGSKNATPKTLFSLWEDQRAGAVPVVTVMSTVDGFHGERTNNGEVPRRTLVRALRTKTTAYSTHMLKTDDPVHWLDLTAPTIGAGTFAGRRGRLTPEH